MLPEAHPLINSITQSFGDNAEMKLSAVQILEQTFDPNHPSVPQALDHLEAQDKKKFPSLGKITFWVLAVAGLAFAISSDMRAFLRMAKIYDWELLEDIELPPAPRKLNQQERLILGDSEADYLTDKQRLFESDPTNPAYFAEYAIIYQHEHGSLPTDFLETAERIDPSNSFFIYWAAAATGYDSVEGKRFTGPRPPDRIVDGVKLRSLPREGEHTIKDQTAYEQALELLKKASGMPEFRSYTNQMTRARARLMPTDCVTNYEDGIGSNHFSNLSGVVTLYYVINLMAARAEELSKNANLEEFQLLAAQRESLLKKLANNEDVNTVNENWYQFITYGTVANFQAAAERLELKDLEEAYRKQTDSFIAHNDIIELRRKKGMDTFPLERASPLGFSPAPNSTNFTVIVPSLPDSYLKPMRLVEHELLGRFGILLVSVALLLASLIVFLFRFLTTKIIVLPAKRIAMLLKLSDWIWIFSLGIALPIVVFLYISRLSPVSGRDFSCSHFQFMFPGIHLATLLLTLLLAPAIITRWRLTGRSAAFKFGSRLDLLALPVIAVMLVYAIVAYPVLLNVRLNDLTRFCLSLPLLGWLAFVFFNGLRIFFGSASSRLIQTATAIAVLPAYPLSILALCITLPIYIKAERQGLVEDKLIFIDPETSELGAYEFKVAAQKRKEINAILGFK